jgi:hypothetical protein
MKVVKMPYLYVLFKSPINNLNLKKKKNLLKSDEAVKRASKVAF